MRIFCNGKLAGEGGRVREGCGEDLTEQIEALPIDRKEHSYTCPRCGNEGRVCRLPELGEV